MWEASAGWNRRTWIESLPTVGSSKLESIIALRCSEQKPTGDSAAESAIGCLAEGTHPRTEGWAAAKRHKAISLEYKNQILTENILQGVE